MAHKNDDELDSLELSRRAQADIEEIAVEFELGMQQLGAGLDTAMDLARYEQMGMTARPFDEDTRHKLADAVFLPILGGEVLRNGQRLASPTFKVSTLERAIRHGYLSGRKDANKLTVSIRELREWLSQGALSGPVAAVRQPRTQSAFTARETERKIGAAQNTMSRIDALILKSKRHKQ
ncbi:hypothetical protein [Rhizobium sp. Leaf383]|uniref:hypothetical protein n=1 Tax=Rhizobium sp. Leaf383 TaxID=1736357 RepID=UPI000715A3FB|nr:hypothetical protein [Rhizobium sp. Leaf383]KQS84853.1 hypothetical protein ASG58_20385 [Rhizobium sp. Leaf383]